MQRLKEVLQHIFAIPELRRRILFTLGLLVVFRLGIFIPIPGIDLTVLDAIREQFRQASSQAAGQFFGFLNIFSGGAFEQFSLFGLGIMPYISASIIFQLLIKAVPTLEALAKEGPSGYRKINQYTRYSTIPIALFQGWFMIKFMEGQRVPTGALVSHPSFLPPWSFELPALAGLTAGSLFVMWLGEQISEYGIGNGASLIIMAGIIDGMPDAVQRVYIGIRTGNQNFFNVLVLVATYVGVVVAIVFMTQAQRRIPVQYPRHVRGGRMVGGLRHYLPLSVNQAGVMPVIFASSLMAVPQMIAQAAGSRTLQTIFGGSPGFWFSVMYVGLVVFFTYFWTALFFQPREMANQLKEHGSFVPGIRPGTNTEEYLEYVMSRVTLAGACFLSLVALMPNLISAWLRMDEAVTRFLGGTGILIVVGVGLDLMRKVESHLLMRQYEGFLKKGRIRGRR